MVNLPSTFCIGATPIGPGHPAFLIAEIGQAHDGSLGTAHAYIDAVAGSGVNAIKFQTHIAAAESTPAEQFRVKFSPQDATRYDYWKRMEFTPDQWRGLAEHASDRGLIFLSSAFSTAAVDLLDGLGMTAWKVGAGEIGSLPMLDRMAKTKRPVLLSSGLSSWEDLDAAVSCVQTAGAPVALLQCTTAYPCPAEKVGLNVMGQLRERYGCPVGLSDHSGKIYAGLAAATLGANLLEVHVVFSRECFGPDVPASLTTKELRQLAEGVRFVETALANPVDKEAIAEDLASVRRTFGKSVVAARPLPAGHCITADDLAFKKPGTGIPASKYQSVIGTTTKRSIAPDTLLSEDDFE